MEHILVHFPLSRPVLIDGEKSGKTNAILRVEEGRHTLSLGDPQDYKPSSRTVNHTSGSPVMSGRTITGVSSFVFVIIAFCICSFSIDQSYAAQKPAGTRVVKVHDGDTVTLVISGRMRKTRLIGIDAPEMNQRPWGRQAKEHLIGIMNNTGWLVTVETDEVTHDKYGRALVYLWTNNNELINERMVLDGYAVLFTIKPNVKYRDTFSRAEQRARQELKGIWGPKGLKEAPVKYREKHPRKQN
ncbi:MAG: thermonuclease family protein [Nitrospirae bacterium]|nr:thermonuclease family protein [Nitrospirota bacterium]